MKEKIIRIVTFLVIMIIGVSIGYGIPVLISDRYAEDKFIEYIMENGDEIKKHDDNYFYLDTCHMYYYTDITIRVNPNDRLYIIFWGDRENDFMWNFKSDKSLDIDIPLLKSENKDAKKYIELYELIISKR